MASGAEPRVILVHVGGGTGGGPTNDVSSEEADVFTPNQIEATRDDIVQFQFSGSPGNHTVTQSSFATPCEPLQGGFDSGWVTVFQQINPFPAWNLTITNDAEPIWFFCKQDLGVPSHCKAGMVGVINIGSISFNEFESAASAASTVGQEQGGFIGVNAAATGPPTIPSGAQYLNPNLIPDSSTTSALSTSPSSASMSPANQSAFPSPSALDTGHPAPPPSQSGAAQHSGPHVAVIAGATTAAVLLLLGLGIVLLLLLRRRRNRAIAREDSRSQHEQGHAGQYHEGHDPVYGTDGATHMSETTLLAAVSLRDALAYPQPHDADMERVMAEQRAVEAEYAPPTAWVVDEKGLPSTASRPPSQAQSHSHRPQDTRAPHEANLQRVLQKHREAEAEYAHARDIAGVRDENAAQVQADVPSPASSSAVPQRETTLTTIAAEVASLRAQMARLESERRGELPPAYD